jgi:hypothetical protein
MQTRRDWMARHSLPPSYPVHARRGFSIPSAASGILDRPLSRAMTAEGVVRIETVMRAVSDWNCHCEERSDEAIHSSFARRNGLLRGARHRARVRATRWLTMTVSVAFAPRNDVAPISKTRPRDLAARCVRAFAKNRPPVEIRGRRECRARDAPAASRAMKKAHERSHHGHTGTTRHSPRNGLRLTSRSPR